MNIKIAIGIAIVIIAIGVASVILADDSTNSLDDDMAPIEDEGKVFHVNPKAAIDTSSGLLP